MKLSEHILAMQALMAAHGDIEIMKADYSHGYVELDEARVTRYDEETGGQYDQADADRAKYVIESYDKDVADGETIWNDPVGKLSLAWGTKEKFFAALEQNRNRYQEILSVWAEGQKVIII